ncbi:MAG: hypothetical protein OEY20_13675, partial [Gemmatimonadota bacterium]|nr:hypothetical protein [Gemmatimonadota bacterium]
SATVPERDADAGAEVSVSRAAGGTRNGRLAANDARPGHDAPAGDGPAARPDGAGGGPSLGGTIAKALVVALIVVVVARVVWLVLHEGW